MQHAITPLLPPLQGQSFAKDPEDRCCWCVIDEGWEPVAAALGGSLAATDRVLFARLGKDRCR